MRGRAFLISLATWLVATAALAGGLGWYARRHHLPEQRLSQALAGGDGCIVIAGDSRMDAATDVAALRAGLRAANSDRCVVELSLGAVDVGGVALTVRRYLERGPKPALFVVGKAGDSLVSGFDPVQPEEMIGNNAVHLTWSRARDVLADVPGFPLASVGAFDSGFRLLLASATSLGQYQSLISAKTQALGASLTHAGGAERNRFGALGDMAGLESGLRARAPGRLSAAMAASEARRLGPWFEEIAASLSERKIPFVVVELPMRSTYRTGVMDTPLARSYQAWFAAELPRWGGRLLDLSREAWVADDLFDDDLHLGDKGAALFSNDLGRRVDAGR